MGTFSDWQQREMDAAFFGDGPGGDGPAVGGISWTTCLAPTESGWPCLKGVEVSIHGVPTGKTRCTAHTVTP